MSEDQTPANPAPRPRETTMPEPTRDGQHKFAEHLQAAVASELYARAQQLDTEALVLQAEATRANPPAAHRLRIRGEEREKVAAELIERAQEITTVSPAAAPSSVQGDTTPATPDDEPATVSLCGVPHRISCNLVTEADEQWCTCDGPQRVGEALLARLNSLSSVQDSESSCSCVHAPERHGSNAGGCIECPCRATSKDEGHRND